MPISCTSKFAVKANNCLQEHLLGPPPCQSNPVQPNERPSYLNRCLALVVSRDASLPPHSTSSRDLRRTIPLTGRNRSAKSRRSGRDAYIWRCPAVDYRTME